MSVMCDWEIKKAIESGNLLIEPFDESLINPASLDFRLGSKFTFTEVTGKVKANLNGKTVSVIDPKNKDSFKDTTIETDEFVLAPGQSILACSLETFDFLSLTDGIACEVKGKSSLGRVFVANSPVAGWVDPGFKGVLTLELTNLSDKYIKLTAGMKIGQLILHKISRPSLDYKSTGRYNDQSEAAGSLGV